MKRILSIVLIFVLAFNFLGCNNLFENKATEQTNQSTETEEAKETKGLEGLGHRKIAVNHREQVFEKYLSSIMYIAEVNFVGKTVYCRERYENDKYLADLYEFEVIKSLRGDLPNKLIVASGEPGNGIPRYDLEYKEGQRYLLLLSEYYTRTNRRIDFCPESLIIPLDNSGNPDMASSLIYEEPFERYVESEKIKTAIKNGTFVDYLLDATKDNPTHDQASGFIDDANFENMYNLAEYAVIVRIVEPRERPRPENFDYAKNYSCEVLTCLKGEINYDYIYVPLPISKVEKSGLYVLLVEPLGSADSSSWILAGYQSVAPLNDLTRYN